MPGWLAVTFAGEDVCCAHVVSGGAKPRVEMAACRPLSPADGSGLEKLSRELHLARYRCTTLLAGAEYHLLLVDAPNVPNDELKTAIRWRIKDLLDYHVDDATVDVLDIPPDKASPSRSHSMYAVAAPNALIRKRIALFEEAKVPLEVIDIPEMAQRNLAALLEQEGRGLAMLSFGPDGGLFTVTYRGELYLSRRMDVSAEQLGVGPEEGRLPHFERVTLELQRSLDHFDRQFHFVTVPKLVLGPLPGGAAFQAYLAANLYLPVETLDLSDILDVGSVPALREPGAQARYFFALGAALRQEEKAL